jgi:hypothetical protein
MIEPFPEEIGMAKGQQKSNKEQKKPKKDTAAKVVAGTPIVPTITTSILPKGKEKKKQ